MVCTRSAIVVGFHKFIWFLGNINILSKTSNQARFFKYYKPMIAASAQRSPSMAAETMPPA